MERSCPPKLVCMYVTSSIALNNNFAKNVCYFLSFYSHENASGFYRVSSYFIVKVLCDIVPMRILPFCYVSSLSLSLSISSSLCLYISFIVSFLFQSLSLFLSSNGSSVLVPGTEILTSQGYNTKWLQYNQIRLGGHLALIVPHPQLHYSKAHKEKEIKEQ